VAQRPALSEFHDLPRRPDVSPSPCCDGSLRNHGMVVWQSVFAISGRRRIALASPLAVFPSDISGYNGPAWSISTEMLANVAFPVFTFFLLACPAAISAIIGILAIVGISALGYLNHGSLDLARSNTLSPAIRCFCEFGLGMLIYRWRSETVANWVAIATTAAFGLALAVGATDALVVVLMMPVIFAIAANKGLIAAMLGAKPLHFLGELSFSIYLVHLPVIIAIQYFVAAPLVVAAVALLTTLAVSVVTYRLVEVPARDRAKRLAAGITPRLGDLSNVRS
jgi:peptidoglycan/LPS O-acetylase OafA/YrhL